MKHGTWSFQQSSLFKPAVFGARTIRDSRVEVRRKRQERVVVGNGCKGKLNPAGKRTSCILIRGSRTSSYSFPPFIPALRSMSSLGLLPFEESLQNEQQQAPQHLLVCTFLRITDLSFRFYTFILILASVSAFCSFYLNIFIILAPHNFLLTTLSFTSDRTFSFRANNFHLRIMEASSRFALAFPSEIRICSLLVISMKMSYSAVPLRTCCRDFFSYDRFQPCLV